MDKYLIWIVVGAAILASAGLGAFIQTWWYHKGELSKRRIPHKLVLQGRALVNAQERKVWQWLAQTFPNHLVMIKIPVSRFTTPLATDDQQDWFQALHKIYCTFTICDTEGAVVGCIDVLRSSNSALKNRALKHRLLSLCGLHYWVVDSKKLPNTNSIRSIFLGGKATAKTESTEPAITGSEFDDTSEQQKVYLLRQRHERSLGHPSQARTIFSRLSSHDAVDSQPSTNWPQDALDFQLDQRYQNLR